MARGRSAHAEGYHTEANAQYSHAEGSFTVASSQSQHVQGENNIADTTGSETERGAYAHIVGNGRADNARSNAHTLDWQGNAWYAGQVTVGPDNQPLAKANHNHDTAYDTKGAAATVQSNLTSHIGDTVKHITAAERTLWNGKAAASDLTGHTGNKANPHGVTAAQVGAATRTLYSVTLPVNWSGAGPYTQTVAISGITAAMAPVADVVLSTVTATAKAQLEAWGCVSRMVTNNGSITATCYDTKPVTAIPIQLLVVQ